MQRCPLFLDESTESTGVRRRSRSEVRPEKRLGQRLPIEIDVDVEGAAYRFRAATANLSPGGMFVLTPHPIPVGTHVMLTFALPSGQKLEVLGVVQWRRDRHEEESQPGIGLGFFCLDPEPKAVLHRFCEVRAPLYLEADLEE